VTEDNFDLIVIGAGIAGLSAARAASKRGLQVLVLEAAEACREKIGSGVASAETVLALEEFYGPVPREILVEPSRIHGFRVHAPPLAPGELRFPWPALRLDRRNLQRFQLARCGAVSRFGQGVASISLSEDGGSVVLHDGTRLRAKVLIDATGRERLSLPEEPVQRLGVAGRGRRARFIARLSYDADTPDPGWHELLVGDDYLAWFQVGRKQLWLEIELCDARLWRLVQGAVVQFLTSKRGAKLLRERSASFCSALRPRELDLGAGRLLRVGDAAGAFDQLGMGLGAAIETGAAAGAAASYAEDLPGALEVYKRSCRELSQRRAREHSARALRAGTIGCLGFGRSLADVFSEHGFLDRWRARRRLRDSITAWTRLGSLRRPDGLLP